MGFNGNKMILMLEAAMKKTIQLVGGDGGVTSIKEQLEILERLKKLPECSSDIDFDATWAPIDTLIALCENGPIEDGDVPSKRERDQLVEAGYAARISVNGKQGFNAATYKGNNAYCRLFDAHSLNEAKSVRLTRRLLAKTSSKNSKS